MNNPAQHQPPNALPRRAAQAEIDQQVAEFLAGGGTIQRLATTPPAPLRDPVVGWNAEQDAASRRRGGKAAAAKTRKFGSLLGDPPLPKRGVGNRGNARPRNRIPLTPIAEQVNPW